MNLYQDWQQALAKAVTRTEELCQMLELDYASLLAMIESNPSFPLRVPRSFVARMEKGNIKDPLLLQILPLKKEHEIAVGFCRDPLDENQSNPVPGLLHKYHGRVLLISTGACAVHCRYCFRQYFPYEDNHHSSARKQALDYIAQNPSIEEVILSGGDPLIIKDPQLVNLIAHLSEIPHLKTLRIHTRLPIVLPERITPELIAILTENRLQNVIVVHCNHPKEIDESVKQKLLSLRAAGITLLNQSVLLKEVNDNAEILIQLSKQLFSAGVLPYYLHLLDSVQGSQHFAVSAEQGIELIQQITSQLPGYLVPKFVQEVPGQSAKIAVVGSGL